MTSELDIWTDAIRRSAAGERVAVGGRLLPSMPDAQLQRNTVGQAGPAAMEEALTFAADCRAAFASSPQFGQPGTVLLDFGTGWGRIARCFLCDFAAENIVGVDVDPDLIAVCRSTFPGPHFLRCDAMPPVAIPAASVDFIVGYSVFSHLSERACSAWLREFARLLRPGGMVALTTRGEWFFDYAASLPPQDDYSRALSRMFADFGTAKAAYQRGEFVHSAAYGVAGGGAREGDFYGETFIPERYARDVLGSILPLAGFHRTPGHPIMFFSKPLASEKEPSGR